MLLDLTREEVLSVLLNRVAEMDADEAREELYQFYEEVRYPKMDDKSLAVEFHEKMVSPLLTGPEDLDIEDDFSDSMNSH